MGLRIKIENADYSINNVGKYLTVAENYLDKSGITNPTQINAITTFIETLEGGGIINKMLGLWLFVGLDYDSIKHNVVDLDNIDLYTLNSLSGAIVLNGLDLSASTGIDTGFIGDADFTQNGHLAFYNSDIETDLISFGMHDIDASNSGTGMSLSRSAGIAPEKISFGLKGSTPSNTALANTERGLFIGSRLSSSARVYSKGVLIEDITRTSTGAPASNLTIGTGSSIPAYRPNAKFQISSVGENLTQGEVVIYSDACEQLMTDLGR